MINIVLSYIISYMDDLLNFSYWMEKKVGEEFHAYGMQVSWIIWIVYVAYVLEEDALVSRRCLSAEREIWRRCQSYSRWVSIFCWLFVFLPHQ